MGDVHEDWLREALAKHGFKTSAPTVAKSNGTDEHLERQAAKVAAERAELERLETFKRMCPGNQLPREVIFGAKTE